MSTNDRSAARVPPVAVVTGAASGIGRELIVQFGAAGYRIAAVDKSADALEAAAEAARKAGAADVVTTALDVSSALAMNAFAARVREAFGRVDVVVNNAGITRLGTFSDTPAEGFNDVINTNFFGVVNGSRAFLDDLVKTQGSLVNMSSVAGLIGMMEQCAYCASKFAIRGFTETLMLEMKGRGVHVAIAYPGGIRTNIMRSAVYEIDKNPDALIERIERLSLRNTPTQAAMTIIRGVKRRSPRILIGKDAVFVFLLQRLFPLGSLNFMKRVSEHVLRRP
jgi:NAD(P)-dependent dehydrogenase (short-subunit alcohol dehydrogenase family)